MSPDPSLIIEKAFLRHGPVAVYDMPKDVDAGGPAAGRTSGHPCLFSAYEGWMKGAFLELAEDDYGCGGCGHWMFGVEARPFEDLVDFLYGQEALKASRELVVEWLRHSRPYVPQHRRIVIGPVRGDIYEYARTVTFFVDPDRLSILLLAANYHAAPGDPAPVRAPFGSGCMQLLAAFESLDVPQAIIGSTDMAMRRFLPPDVIAFTMTKPMYERVCSIGEGSFLSRPFLGALKKARGWG